MTKDVTLPLDEFGQRALERFARRRSDSPAKAVRMASLYYLADRETRRPAWRVPHLASGSESTHSLRIELDDATWEALSEEAEHQGVSTELLAMHAVLYFLADIDSGRIVGLLEDALDGLEES